MVSRNEYNIIINYSDHVVANFLVELLHSVPSIRFRCPVVLPTVVGYSIYKIAMVTVIMILSGTIDWEIWFGYASNDIVNLVIRRWWLVWLCLYGYVYVYEWMNECVYRFFPCLHTYRMNDSLSYVDDDSYRYVCMVMLWMDEWMCISFFSLIFILTEWIIEMHERVEVLTWLPKRHSRNRLCISIWLVLPRRAKERVSCRCRTFGPTLV